MSECPRITLIVDGVRFEVDKRKIVDKSRYFNSLFSHNFSDSKANEQIVRYDFDPSVIQDFCDWIEEDPPASVHDESHQIKISLQKYLSDSFERLKQLLELSIIYLVDELSVELSDIVVQHWLQPSHLLDIWRVARELSLAPLTDAAFAASLERLAEIPRDELLALPLADFLQLTANPSAGCEAGQLLALVEQRIAAEAEGSGCEEDQLRRLRQRLLRERGPGRPQAMRCFFAETYREAGGRELQAKTVYAFREASRAFAELVEVWRVDECGRDLAGVGLVGRGFSVYKIGGEMKLGSCKFNMNIWRYCLLSRKWYYLARLRKARRHMVSALVDHSLVLIGGVSRYRLKTSSVEVLDLRSGAWARAPDVPESFTDTPPSCLMRGVVLVCVSSLYMFDARGARWLPVEHHIEPEHLRNVKCLAAHGDTLFIGKEGGLFHDYRVVWSRSADASIRSARVVRAPCRRGPLRSACDKVHIDARGVLSGIVYQADKVVVECATFDEQADVTFAVHDFHLPGASLAPISCFDLTDPASLYSLLLD